MPYNHYAVHFKESRDFSPMETNETPSVRELWLRAFNHVRNTIDVATVWLAMQAAVPIAIDGHSFVAGLAAEDQYLASNLQTHEATTAIEDALQQLTGRVLALQIIHGTTLSEWEAQKPALTGQARPAAPAPAAAPPPPAAAPPAAPFPAASPRPGSSAFDAPAPEPAPSWDKLSERLAQSYKTSPVKHAQGQARFVLRAARLISDTMDSLLPASGLPPDEAGERALFRSMERLGSIINLDPLFLALEVMRYRQAQGKETF